MKILFFTSLFIVSIYVITFAKDTVNVQKNDSIYTISFSLIDGSKRKMSDFKDKVVLVVNVASYCGLTSQYQKLQTLYETYNKDGFEIIAFPCNQFGNQEPGSSQQIKAFCETNYKTTFLIAEKINVNGKDKHELYNYFSSIQDKSINKSISWNFTKFLIDKNGNVIDRFSPIKSPMSKSIRSAIENALDIKGS